MVSAVESAIQLFFLAKSVFRVPSIAIDSYWDMRAVDAETSATASFGAEEGSRT